jgi:predicted nucleic acid-binding protein
VKTIVDSSGWIEFATDGPLADRYEEHLRHAEDLLTPSIVLYEVYKRLKRDGTQALADAFAAAMGKTHIIPFDDALALSAADISLEHHLAMADAIVYATARHHKARLVTSDADFKDLPGVVYFKKSS